MYRLIRLAGVGLALAVGAAASQSEAQQPAPAQKPAPARPAAPGSLPQERVRGDVVSLSGDTLEMKSRAGQDLKLKLAAVPTVVVSEKTDLDSIGEGAFIGTTAVPQKDGSLRAVEVHVFPDSMRGTGEGHRPWDLQPGSTMTNATVAKVQGGAGKARQRSTMTNATVAKVADAGGGRTIQLKYPGGEKSVVVPPGTPIVKLSPADVSLLTPGAHIFAVVARLPNGTLAAQRITVGKDGSVPPM
jgi:hypothetical protein